MKKKDILKKIEEQVARGIKNPNLGGDPVGLKITKQALKKSKEENDSYYKELDKKFRDYMELDVKDNPSPKVNGTEEDHKMYYGSGMEGLKYDDQGTEKNKKFVERNKELNKPSKDYYLKKDQVSDSYGKIMKDGEHYKKHKYEKPDEYEKTPKVRITQESINKNTMKQLNYKKPFLSYERAIGLIPEGYKVDGNKFKMTDGVETYTIKWEGDNSGNATVLTYKNSKLVKEDVNKMKHLYEYNSEDTLMKTNDALTENQIFRELINKSRTLVTEQETGTPAPATGTPGDKTTPAAGTTPTTKPKTAEVKPTTIGFSGKVGDENKEVNFYITYMRSGDKQVITNVQLDIAGKRLDKPNANSVSKFAKDYTLSPSSKSTPTKYESVYTIIKKASENKQVVTFDDSKGLLANAKASSTVFPHKYSESYGAKPVPFQDVTISFYPYKIIDQTTGAKEACKLPRYFSVTYKGKESKLRELKIESVKSTGKEFPDSDFGTYAMSNKYQDLFKQIKELGAKTCTA